MSTPTAFLLTKFPNEEHHRIRVCLPGIDRGGALYLEAEAWQLSREEAEQLLKRAVDALNSGVKLETEWATKKPNLPPHPRHEKNMSTPENPPMKRPKTVRQHIWRLIRQGFTDRRIQDILCREWAAWYLSNIERRIEEERRHLLED